MDRRMPPWEHDIYGPVLTSTGEVRVGDAHPLFRRHVTAAGKRSRGLGDFACCTTFFFRLLMTTALEDMPKRRHAFPRDCPDSMAPEEGGDGGRGGGHVL